MAVRNPLVSIGGQVQEIPGTDTIRDSRPLITRTLSLSNGGQGSGLSSWLSVTRTVTGTNFGFRIPLRFLDDVTSYTVKLRNFDQFLGVNGGASLTLDGMTIGQMTAPSTGAIAQTGNFNGSAGTSLATSGAIPNTVSFLTVNGSGGLSANTDYCLGISFHAAATTTLLVGVGQCWYWSNSTSAHVAATNSSGATSATQFIPLDVVIEYTTTTRKKAFLCVGDSLPEGAQGVNYYLNGATNLVATPWHLGYVRQWAERRGDVNVQTQCLFSSKAQDWANSSYGGWTRQSTASGQWDGAILTLGCNDIASGTTYSTLLGYYASCITNLRAIVGNSVPLYVVNIMPETFTTGTNSKEYYRYQMNEYLGQHPAGITGCIDADSAVRGWLTTGGAAATNTMDLALSCDGIHPSRQGSIRLADMLAAAIP